MSKLPVIDFPTYDVELISRGKTKFRPFLVREQKILMMAMESKEFDSVIGAVKQIIKNCLLDQTINVDDLPMADMEILFLNIRAKSMGEVLQLYYKCNNTEGMIDKKSCGMVLDIEVNVLETEPLNVLPKNIILTDNIMVEMRYPTFQLLSQLDNAKDFLGAEMIVVAGCMDKIYHNGEITEIDKGTQEEVMEFLSDLPVEKYESMRDWVKASPKITKNVTTSCPKCSKVHNIKLEGLADFFQ